MSPRARKRGAVAVEDRLNEGLLAHVKGGKRKRGDASGPVTDDIITRTAGLGTGATDFESLLDIAK